jgi:ankyrin repeat protein
MRGGADPTGFRDSNGLACLHYVSAGSDQAIQTSMVLAYTADNINSVKTLSGETPLHIAVRADAYESAKLLLAHGASVSCCSLNGHTPLNLCESETMLELLLEHQ